MRYVVAVFLLFSLFGCKEPQKPASNQYQMSIAPSGQVYLLNQITGEIKVVDVAQGDSKSKRLTVGSTYETEDGKILIYTGKGKFTDRPPIDSFWKK